MAPKLFWPWLVCALLLLYIVFYAGSGSGVACEGRAPAPSQHPPALPAADALAPCSAPPPQRLWSVGLATGTDKFTNSVGRGHAYQAIYEEFLGPLHCRPLNILEIGLGCNAGIAEAGQSLAMWLHYFPLATLTVFEYDGRCVDEWVAKDPMGIGSDVLKRRVVWIKGDQSSTGDLAPALARGPFDFVLDDGGHSFRQQIVSLVVLLPAVRPGGMYIVEDLGTSFSFAEHPVAKPWNDWPVTTAAYLAKMLAVKHMPVSKPPVWRAEPYDEGHFPGLADVARQTKHMVCAQETCILRVWREGEAAAAPPPVGVGVPHHLPA